MRVKTRWSQKDRERSTGQVASAVGIAIWKIAQNGVLKLENEGFQTDTQRQRLDIIAEFLAFSIQNADRMFYGKGEEEERRTFITELAIYLAGFYAENRLDFEPEVDHRSNFISLLNARMSDYSECAYTDEDGPSFVMRRNFGNYVAKVMGEKDNKWIPDYVMDVQVPEVLTTLKRAMGMVLGSAARG